MKRVHLEPTLAASIISKSLSSILKNSSNADFVGSCLHSLQVDRVAESEKKLNYLVMNIFENHQGVKRRTRAGDGTQIHPRASVDGNHQNMTHNRNNQHMPDEHSIDLSSYVARNEEPNYDRRDASMQMNFPRSGACNLPEFDKKRNCMIVDNNLQFENQLRNNYVEHNSPDHDDNNTMDLTSFVPHTSFYRNEQIEASSAHQVKERKGLISPRPHNRRVMVVEERINFGASTSSCQNQRFIQQNCAIPPEVLNGKKRRTEQNVHKTDQDDCFLDEECNASLKGSTSSPRLYNRRVMIAEDKNNSVAHHQRFDVTSPNKRKCHTSGPNDCFIDEGYKPPLKENSNIPRLYNRRVMVAKDRNNLHASTSQAYNQRLAQQNDVTEHLEDPNRSIGYTSQLNVANVDENGQRDYSFDDKQERENNNVEYESEDVTMNTPMKKLLFTNENSPLSVLSLEFVEEMVPIIELSSNESENKSSSISTSDSKVLEENDNASDSEVLEDVENSDNANVSDSEVLEEVENSDNANVSGSEVLEEVQNSNNANASGSEVLEEVENSDNANASGNEVLEEVQNLHNVNAYLHEHRSCDTDSQNSYNVARKQFFGRERTSINDVPRSLTEQSQEKVNRIRFEIERSAELAMKALESKIIFPLVDQQYLEDYNLECRNVHHNEGDPSLHTTEMDYQQMTTGNLSPYLMPDEICSQDYSEALTTDICTGDIERSILMNSNDSVILNTNPQEEEEEVNSSNESIVSTCNTEEEEEDVISLSSYQTSENSDSESIQQLSQPFIDEKVLDGSDTRDAMPKSQECNGISIVSGHDNGDPKPNSSFNETDIVAGDNSALREEVPDESTPSGRNNDASMPKSDFNNGNGEANDAQIFIFCDTDSDKDTMSVCSQSLLADTQYGS